LRRALAIVLLVAGAAGAADDVALYRQWCARCHGERGDGKGPAAVALAFNGAAPRDFTTGRYKITSVPSGTAPSDDDLARTIAKGIPGTSMPHFEDLLSSAEIARLVAVVRGFATTPRAIGTPLDVGPEPADPESRTRGGSLYRDLGCPTCHGDGGRGDGPSAAQLRGADGNPIVPADLTRPWTFKGGATARDVTMRLIAGIGGTPMPSYLDAASKAQLWDVAHYVGSLARAPSRRAAALGAARATPGAGEPAVRRGEYLAKSGTCFLCHAEMRPDGGYAPGRFGAGGMRVELTHLGTLYTRNLTSDPDTGLGRWSADDLRRALRDGRTPSGRVLSPLDMPWPVLALLTDADVDALHAYLQSLPPVRNLVPAPESASLADGIVRKAAALVAGARLDGVYHPGNAGREPDGGATVEPVTNPRMELGLGVALLALVVLAPRRTRLLLVPLAVGILGVYTWPPFRWMPAALVKAEGPFTTMGGAFNLPPVRPPPAPTPTADDDTTALAQRGRYVATIGTCPLCHTAGPSVTRLWRPFPEMGGGMRVNWAVFGTTYSRNLTPDRDTGLGGWSDAEIERAVRSGVARDGRTMHWQAMPWDHFSHLSPEDMDALIAYLRALPAVHSEIPPPAPPRPGDAAGDAFGFGYEGTFRSDAAHD
jgi:mono/diheme cytochrome c family protein